MSRKTTSIKQRPRKALSKRDRDLEFLETALENNVVAIHAGPDKKKWTKHDLKNIIPITPRQEDVFHAFYQGQQVLAHGSAGTGKTYIALFLAMSEVLKKEHEKLIIVRSAVQSRDIGFMPGDLDEKMAYYEMPYKDIMGELFGRGSTYDDMKEQGLITFMITSYVRGLTWDNAIVVVDEVQNMTFHEINSIITRVGRNTRVILLGDFVQTDLNKRSSDTTGIHDLIAVANKMPHFSVVEFSKDDIVRSELVKSWIEACEDVGVF